MKSASGRAIIDKKPLSAILVPTEFSKFVDDSGNLTSLSLYIRSPNIPAILHQAAIPVQPAVPAIYDKNNNIKIPAILFHPGQPEVLGQSPVKGELLYESFCRLMRDRERAFTLQAQRVAKECCTISFVESTIGDQQLKRCKQNSSYITARDSHDSFTHFNCLQSILLCDTSVDVIMRRVIGIFGVKQSSQTFSDFASILDEYKHRFSLDLEDSVHKGFVSIDTLFAILLCTSVDQLRFKPVLERIYARHPSARLTTYEALKGELTEFDNKTYHVATSQPSLDPGASLALAASASPHVLPKPVPVMPTNCLICQKNFTSKQNKRGGWNRKCDVCYKKFVVADSTSGSSNPTSTSNYPASTVASAASAANTAVAANIRN